MYGQKGNEVRSNREREGTYPDSGGRPYKLGWAPLYIGAPALICLSTRPDYLCTQIERYNEVRNHEEWNCCNGADGNGVDGTGGSTGGNYVGDEAELSDSRFYFFSSAL
jgi:hypothetical protein